ncbi:SAM-dependent methyltransferase [Kitasatospora sp. HPMI-4]|uniref:SAM-dependent methyltransferase n=1 Tax=Kitasatospora sp. HPMI-4 TaxID=3448443 RepID=UPI003F1AC6E9
MTEEDAGRYYAAGEVDGFYSAVWGGEDIHTGIYAHAREAVADASRRTVAHTATRIADRLGPGTRVLDLGSGYGGPARYLARTFGCRVTALNISETQNERHRRTNAERGLDDRISVVTGSFQDIPFPAAHFDVVWSQEAFCHSPDRDRLLAEAVRVLRPGGELVFTDVMAAETAGFGQLRDVLARLHVTTLATPRYYQRALTELGLDGVDFEQLDQHLLTHYIRIEEETRSRAAELEGLLGPAYLESLLANLPLWVEACRSGLLRWGVFHARAGSQDGIAPPDSSDSGDPPPARSPLGSPET